MNGNGTKYNAPWRIKERAALADYLRRHVLDGREIVGYLGIIGTLDEKPLPIFKAFPKEDMRRLISHTLHDLGWIPNSVGMKGRIASWRRPEGAK